MLLAVICVGCGAPPPKPGDALNGFLAAFSSGDTTAAANATDDTSTAKPVLDKLRGALKPVSISTTVDQVRSSGDNATTASATYSMTWDLGHNRTWTYQATADLRRINDQWRVHWAPSVIHPKLAAGLTLAVRDQPADPAPVLDRDGTPLLAPQNIVIVLLDPKQAGDLTAVATTLAAALSPFDGTINQQSILDGVAKVPSGQAYQVASLRDTDYQQAKAQIYNLPGVHFTTQTKLLAPSKTFAVQVLTGVRKVADDQLVGKAGWRVATVNAAGAQVDVLFAQQPQPAQTLTTTLSTKIQTAAENALAPVPQQGVIVAIQPSTGDVLAVAQNPAADSQGPIALAGRYPPGSTFKSVTALAALEAGKVTADTPVQCPGTVTIDGRAIPNENQFDKGTIPLHSAFAYSCNTTFAPLAADLSPDALPNAAKQLGLGIDFTLAGASTVTGSVPPTTDTVERASDGFGQGKVVASPFGMALAAATVARGTMPTPTLMRGTPTTANGTATAIPQPVLDPLRSMMREVVSNGTATQLRDLADVAGKTGTAQFGDGTHAHGWFMGYRADHDLAFAVLLVDAGSSTPAVNVAGSFLRALG